MNDRRILVGVIGRPHGTRGLLHVHSYTAVPADLVAYGPLTDEAGRRYSLRWVGEGVAEVAALSDGVSRPVRDRAEAGRLTNRRLYAARDQLPEPDEDEFYFSDLVGLQAVGEGVEGRIAAVHDYGAGVSLEIEVADAPPVLVPFTRACVPEVDLAGGRVRVVPPVERVSPPISEAAE